VCSDAAAEQPEQADDDQIDRDDEVEQARHDQDQDAGDQGRERADGEGQVHACPAKWKLRRYSMRRTDTTWRVKPPMRG